MFVLVGDKPIRTSKRSAEWCLKGIDKCWQEKTEPKNRYAQKIRAQERPAAKGAYDKAREEYKKILVQGVPEKEVAEARKSTEYKEAYDAIGEALGKAPKDQAVKACTAFLKGDK